MNSSPDRQLPLSSGVQPDPSPKKSKKLWIIILIVVVVIGCCCLLVAVGGAGFYLLRSSNGGIINSFQLPSGIDPVLPQNNPQSDSGSPQPTVQPSIVAENPTQEPLIQLPNLFGVTLGDEARCDLCGFSFKKIPDYEYSDNWIFQQMLAPGADEQTGPVVVLMGGRTDQPLSKDEIIQKLKENETGVTFSNQRTIKVGGYEAISFDIEGTVNGTATKGRAVVSGVNSKQLFMMLGLAPTDQWEKVNPYFEAVMNSVSFFDPVSATPTP
jgi:hypothetical protein